MQNPVPSTMISPQWLCLSDCSVDLRSGRVVWADQELRLSHTEARLLHYLVQHSGRVVSWVEILVEVLGQAADAPTSRAYVHLGLLRNKVERDPRNPLHIHALRGVGVQFDVCSNASLSQVA